MSYLILRFRALSPSSVFSSDAFLSLNNDLQCTWEKNLSWISCLVEYLLAVPVQVLYCASIPTTLSWLTFNYLHSFWLNVRNNFFVNLKPPINAGSETFQNCVFPHKIHVGPFWNERNICVISFPFEIWEMCPHIKYHFKTNTFWHRWMDWNLKRSVWIENFSIPNLHSFSVHCTLMYILWQTVLWDFRSSGLSELHLIFKKLILSFYLSLNSHVA